MQYVGNGKLSYRLLSHPLAAASNIMTCREAMSSAAVPMYSGEQSLPNRSAVGFIFDVANELAPICSELWRRGFKAVPIPRGESVPHFVDFLLEPGCFQSAQILSSTGEIALDEDDWCVSVRSSGSLGNARYYGYSSKDIRVVSAVYRDLYSLTQNSLVVSLLPAQYNFSIIAGLAASIIAGARLVQGFSNWNFNNAEIQSFDRIVVLGNPFVLDCLVGNLEDRILGKILVDSGGAPLSIGKIRTLREVGLDVREGYGLTETLSLSHFDTEGSMQALGTVGRPVREVQHAITWEMGRPLLKIAAPWSAVLLDTKTQETVSERKAAVGELITTRDLASVDYAGRVRILGRMDDFPVMGVWPRDTLDALWDLGFTVPCSVQHTAPDEVIVSCAASIDEDAKERSRQKLLEWLCSSNVRVTFIESVRPLHSAKLPRVTKNAQLFKLLE